MSLAIAGYFPHLLHLQPKPIGGPVPDRTPHAEREPVYIKGVEPARDRARRKIHAELDELIERQS